MFRGLHISPGNQNDSTSLAASGATSAANGSCMRPKPTVSWTHNFASLAWMRLARKFSCCSDRAEPKMLKAFCS